MVQIRPKRLTARLFQNMGNPLIEGQEIDEFGMFFKWSKFQIPFIVIFSIWKLTPAAWRVFDC